MTTNYGDELIAGISSKDTSIALSAAQAYETHMRNPADGVNYVLWLTEPPNLTAVHRALIDNLGIPPKLLAVRRTAANRTQKSLMLIKAIQSGIQRVTKV